MSYETKSILEELYMIDPDLRSREKEIITFIEKMQKHRPQIEIDEAFRLELRNKLLTLWENKKLKNSEKQSFFWYFLPFFWGLTAIFLIALSFWPMFFWTDTVTDVTSPEVWKLSFAPDIQEREPNAYGKIWLSPSPVPPPVPAWGWVENRMMMTAETMIADTSMPVMDMPIYSYVYTWVLDMNLWELPVYEKKSLPFSSDDMGWLLSGLNIDGINLSLLKNTRIGSVSLLEDREYGYSVNLDLQWGNVSFYQNWTKWPQPQCGDNGCPPIKESEVPSDDEIITTANTWLNENGIDISYYGEPIIDRDWKIYYARALAEGTEGYIPENFTVIFPFLLDGKKVYEEYGTPRGISLSIDIRTLRVTSMSGLEKYALDRSLYPLENRDVIDEMIRSGGRYTMDTSLTGSGLEVIKISLSNPSLEYVRLYGSYGDGMTKEYFVPSYIFPIENWTDTRGYLPKSIIIPIVEWFRVVQDISNLPMPLEMSTDTVLR